MESSEEARKLVHGAPGSSACRVGGRGLPYPSRACPPRAVRPPAVPSAGLAPPWLGLGLGFGLRLGLGLGLGLDRPNTNCSNPNPNPNPHPNPNPFYLFYIGIIWNN